MIYPWLQEVWQQITAMRVQGRLPHALMLVGPDDVGIESLTHALANALLCEQGKIDPCGDCQSCHLFLAGTHPDYFLIRPSENETIKIDVLRELSQSLTQKPARGCSQVVFIERADCMQVAGANAILKTLEEPEGNVFFILWARQAERLPATIRSRTQNLNCANGSLESMQTWLKANGQLDIKKPWLRITGNRPLAVKALSEENYFGARDSLLQALQTVKEKRQSTLVAAQSFSDWDRSLYFQALLSIAADGFRYCLAVGSEYWVNQDEEIAIRALFSGLGIEQVQSFYDCVERIWRYEQLPQVLNKFLLDAQVWLEWEKLTEVCHAY